MEGVNLFIKSNKYCMIMFLDEFGNVFEFLDIIEYFRMDLFCDLVVLYEICVVYLDEFWMFSNECGV